MFSASMLSLYMDCPFAYQCRYIDKLPEPENPYFELGTKFHSFIPMCFHPDPEVNFLIEKLIKNPWYNGVRGQIKEFEKDTKSIIDGYPFRAIIDAYGDNFILEFKSAAKPWDNLKFEKEIQSQIYIKSEEVRTGKIKKFYYVIVPKDYSPVQIKEVPFDPKKWELIKKTCSDFLKDYEFNPKAYKEKNNNCYFCSFKNHCHVYF